MRRRVLHDAFARAERAFNRGDLDAVFALFADDVEYTPPPALYDGPPIVGRDRVRRFWEQARKRFGEMWITNLDVEETAPLGLFVPPRSFIAARPKSCTTRFGRPPNYTRGE